MKVLDAYIEGEMEAERHVRFERHIAFCSPCLDSLESYRLTVEIRRRSGGRKDGGKLDEMPEVLVQAILDSMRGQNG